MNWGDKVIPQVDDVTFFVKKGFIFAQVFVTI